MHESVPGVPSDSAHCCSPAARRQDLLNISPIVTDAAAAVVDDSFLRCFQGAPPDPWNWNVYLFPTWCLGCLLRFGILFPLRCSRFTCLTLCLLLQGSITLAI